MDRELNSAPTTNELIQALMAAQEQEGREPGTMTAMEIRKATGWGKDKALNELRAAKARGEVEVVKIQITSLADVQMHVPAYRLKPELKSEF